MFCPKCGNELNDGVRFCGKCGASIKIESVPIKEQEKPKNSKGKGIVWVIVVLFIVILLAGVGFFIMLNTNMEFKCRILGHEWQEATYETPKTCVVCDETEGKVLSEVSEESTEEVSEEVSEEASEEVLEETAAETAEQSLEEISEVISEAVDNVDYAMVVEEIKSNGFPSVDAELADALASVIVGAKIFSGYGEYDFANMSADDLFALNYNMIESTMLSGVMNAYQPQTYNELAPEEYGNLYRKEDVDLLMNSFCYGAGSSPDFEVLMHDNEEYIWVLLADGDAWITCDGAMVKEKGEYLLFSAPCFFGSNGQMANEYIYHADILFEKCEDSIFGMRIVYANTEQRYTTVDTVEVSSQLEDYGEKTYGAGNLVDGEFSTTWVEGVSGTGIGEQITIYLGEPKTVQGIEIYNGYLENYYLYDINGKVLEVEVDFGSGNVISKLLDINEFYTYENSAIEESQICPSEIYLSQSVVTDKIVITIKDAIEGSVYSDTCISEIRVY